ncbi:MAG: Fe2+-dependent dioxygenase [Proteobacteria bacterium]|nr:Fe2+-dependent dioxygenase [Pseudomonadota bacterium]
MILCLQQVLTAAEVRSVLDALKDKSFVDGRASGGRSVQGIKHNLEMPHDEPRKRLSQLIHQALARHPTFGYAARPRKLAPFLFSRYEPGMYYGDHVDNPFMLDGPEPIRSDLSMTIFLNDPASYDGGELVMDADTAPTPIKLPAGDAVVYPSTTLHHVAPVTRGARWAAVSWVQSTIRNAGQRQILFDMQLVLDHLWQERQRANDENGPAAAAHKRLQKTQFNLLRLWADV